MSVLGIDVGNATSVVGLARRNGIDVVLNSESKRETPSMVNFASKQVSRGAILLPSRAHVARLRLRRRRAGEGGPRQRRRRRRRRTRHAQDC